MSADGAPIANRDRRGAATGNPNETERAGPTQFVREVKGELRKVVWPTKDEIMNYSVVVFLTIVVLLCFPLFFNVEFVSVCLW